MPPVWEEREESLRHPEFHQIVRNNLHPIGIRANRTRGVVVESVRCFFSPEVVIAIIRNQYFPLERSENNFELARPPETVQFPRSLKMHYRGGP